MGNEARFKNIKFLFSQLEATCNSSFAYITDNPFTTMWDYGFTINRDMDLLHEKLGIMKEFSYI